MFFTTAAAAPRSTCDSSTPSVVAGAAGFLAGAGADSAFAGALGMGLAAAAESAGVAVDLAGAGLGAPFSAGLAGAGAFAGVGGVTGPAFAEVCPFPDAAADGAEVSCDGSGL